MQSKLVLKVIVFLGGVCLSFQSFLKYRFQFHWFYLIYYKLFLEKNRQNHLSVETKDTAHRSFSLCVLLISVNMWVRRMTGTDFHVEIVGVLPRVWAFRSPCHVSVQLSPAPSDSHDIYSLFSLHWYLRKSLCLHGFVLLKTVFFLLESVIFLNIYVGLPRALKYNLLIVF